MAADGSTDNPIPAVRVDAVAEAAPVVVPAVVEEAPAIAEVAPAAVVAAPAVVVPEAKLELVGEKPSLLETTGKKPEPAKPAEPEIKPEADKAPEKKPEAVVDPAKAPENAPEKPAAEVAAAAIPEAPAAIDYKYTLPATLKMDDALKGEAHAAFDAFRANPAEGAQALIDLHARTMQAYAEQLQTETVRGQHKVFNETRSAWNKEIMADPELGGSGYATASKAVARMRDMLVSSAVPGTPVYQQHLKEAEDFYRITGAGDHPVLWRILHNAARFFDEPALPPSNPKPTPNNGLAPGGRRDRMYDHPSSSKASS